MAQLRNTRSAVSKSPVPKSPVPKLAVPKSAVSKSPVPKSARQKCKNTGAKFEELSAEIVLEIFDYLVAHEICNSFYGLNSRFKQLVSNATNVRLDLTRTETKLFRTFQKIFNEQHVISLKLLYENINLLEIFSHSKRLQSIALYEVPLSAFENDIPTLLNAFKHQLRDLHIAFSNMKFTGSGERAGQSFGYLLTELPFLTNLKLECSKGIDLITYMPSTIVNNTIRSLTIQIAERRRLIPLLYRFQKLKVLTLFTLYTGGSREKKAQPAENIRYYRDQISEKTSMEYPAKLRHLILHTGAYLGVVQELLPLITPPTLFTFSFVHKRTPVKIPIPRRQPPFLDSTQWHDMMKTFLPPKMRELHIEYDDVDDTMSRTNPERVKKEFIQYYGEDFLLEVFFSYDKDTKLMSFDVHFI
ncbi:unnamed protein product [Rotaria magnacalcarata]|uniref:F-box domain-containing protein n=1 Tax=Rotaria magnacalcarata TaxID=392030 RepID=A0A815Y8B8_9BILA|nr:unnamed protein product [Rotaria magnacalcarata]CAF1662660.1 unnamed protein product [Rotaria magnacalcarata]CAF2025910.1 unnamed protein product [Rotaria magnacalcarata]CAF3858256.1 unnamed protein product [Rotaria magnacalcarata]CAF3966856.1 unnamed protein product [Rotaria magnacalcarata]